MICFADGSSAEWGIYQGINDLRAKDYIWVHFALPVSAIMAVGRVRDVPHFSKKLDKHAIWIDWDWKLTKRLQENPIPYSAHHQTVPVSVREANLKTQNVIDLKCSAISASEIEEIASISSSYVDLFSSCCRTKSAKR